MADFNQTVTNSIRCFGPGPATQWGAAALGTMVWGTTKWGEGSFDPVNLIGKLISESQTCDSGIGSRDIFHLIADVQTITPTSDVSKYVGRTIDFGSITTDMETSFESLMSGDWYYNFPSNVSDPEDRTFPTYAQPSAASTSFTSAAGTSTTWS